MWLFFYHLWEKLLNLKTKYKKDENAEKCFLFRQLDWWETVHAYSVEYFSGKYPKIRRFSGKQLPRSLFLYLKENFKEGIYLWNLRYFLEYFYRTSSGRCFWLNLLTDACSIMCVKSTARLDAHESWLPWWFNSERSASFTYCVIVFAVMLNQHNMFKINNESHQR